MDTVFYFIFTGNFKLWLPFIYIDCYYLKENNILSNLTACLIFIKYHIYNFSDCIGKIFFKILFSYSNSYQYFLIRIHFFQFLNLFQYFHSPSHNFVLHFSPCLCLVYLEKVLFGLKKGRGKAEVLPMVFLKPLLGKLTLTLTFNMCMQDLVHFLIMF